MAHSAVGDGTFGFMLGAGRKIQHFDLVCKS